MSTDTKDVRERLRDILSNEGAILPRTLIRDALAEIERLRVDAERWRTFWSAINGERVTLWTVVGGGPRESVFMIPDLVLEKIDAAIREGKTK